MQENNQLHFYFEPENTPNDAQIAFAPEAADDSHLRYTAGKTGSWETCIKTGSLGSTQN